MMHLVRYPILILLTVAGVELATASDFVTGNLAQFDDNGIWTWYSDERTVVDTNRNKLVVGVDENASGLGGLPRDGNINRDHLGLANGPQAERYTLMANRDSFGGGDDHNAPGLLRTGTETTWAIDRVTTKIISITWYRIYDRTQLAVRSPKQTSTGASHSGATDFRMASYSNPL